MGSDNLGVRSAASGSWSSESDSTVQSHAFEDGGGLFEIGAGAGGDDTGAFTEVGDAASSLRDAASRRRCCSLDDDVEDDEGLLALLLLRRVLCGNGGRAFCASAARGEGDLDDELLFCGGRSSGMLSNWSDILSEPQAEDKMPRKLFAFAAIELRFEATDVEEDLVIKGRGAFDFL